MRTLLGPVNSVLISEGVLISGVLTKNAYSSVIHCPVFMNF